TAKVPGERAEPAVASFSPRLCEHEAREATVLAGALVDDRSCDRQVGVQLVGRVAGRFLCGLDVPGVEDRTAAVRGLVDVTIDRIEDPWSLVSCDVEEKPLHVDDDQPRSVGSGRR